jgi:hypothetical protein
MEHMEVLKHVTQSVSAMQDLSWMTSVSRSQWEDWKGASGI